MKFGNLVVCCRADGVVQDNGRCRVAWKCRCDCGNTVVVLGDNLRRKRTTSCGCQRRKIVSEKHTTHGSSSDALYGVWCAMKSRCINVNDAHYEDYGGRGIYVCDEWIDNYDSFREWSVYNGYGKNLTIDRIDNNAEYSPSNCRWVNRKQQANNRRNNHKITFNGETHNITEWASVIGINPKTLFNRIYSGWDLTSAFSK